MRPAAFLDRNALVNFGEGGPETFQWSGGAIEAIRALNDRGYYVFVMSHRSGSAQTTRAVDEPCVLNAAMQEQLATEGAHVDRFYGKLNSPADVGSRRAIDAAKQKPVSNLFLEAMNEWPIVGEQSFFIGVSGRRFRSGAKRGNRGACVRPRRS